MLLNNQSLVAELANYADEGIVGIEIVFPDGRKVFARAHSVYREQDETREAYLTISSELPPGWLLISGDGEIPQLSTSAHFEPQGA